MELDNSAEYQVHGNTKYRYPFIFNPEQFRHELKELFKFQREPIKVTKTILLLCGILLTPLTIIGLTAGYCRAFNRFWRSRGMPPRLYDLPPIFLAAMGIGVLFVWVIVVLSIILLSQVSGSDVDKAKFILTYLLFNGFFSMIVFNIFMRWKNGIANYQKHIGEHGTAEFAGPNDLQEYILNDGLYIGGPCKLHKRSHILTVSGTQGGKSVNLLVNAIMGFGGYLSSWCIIDPKGELAAITSAYLKSIGKRIIILNPFDLLGDLIASTGWYNPLDLLSDKSSIHLSDDIELLAEMLVPLSAKDHNAFFTDSARNVISSLMLHLICSSEPGKAHLEKLWEWCRLFGDEWIALLSDMATSKDPVHGATIRNAANEIARMQESPETFASIMSNALKATNFIKSPALRESMTSDFDPYTLADGNTVVYIVFPVDKLKSHAAYLRLVTTSMLRAVVRQPDKRVTFLYDEMGNLGYMSEIETALAAYAGFNVTMWLVYQDLSQIKAVYGDKWESIVANCRVRQYFSIFDNFTCTYVSKALGVTTDTLYKRDWFGNINEVKNTKRELATPDEVRKISKDELIVFIDENNGARFSKFPYYENPALRKNGLILYRPNPYIRHAK